MRSLFALLAMSATAGAAPTSIDADFELVRIPVETTASALHANSRTIYLNRAGITLRPGSNDSRTQTSSLVQQQTQLAGWASTDTAWDQVMDCMTEIWAPFGVAITDVDPGTTPHIEAVFTPSPLPMGMPAKIGGVAPMSTTCAIVEHAIVFTFTDNVRTPRRICEVMSQEVGHAYGLDHELEASDPMTYLSFDGERSFQDMDVACGETTARPCGIGSHVCRATQNSFRLLTERLTPPIDMPDTMPPEVAVSPANGAVVGTRFTVTATTESTARATLTLDGSIVGTKTAPPYAWTVSAATGSHALAIEVTDAAGNAVVHELEIFVDETQESSDDEPPVGCSAGGSPGLLLAALLFARRRRRATSRA